MFRLLRVIIGPSSELIQNNLIPSALWDPVALKIVGAVVFLRSIKIYKYRQNTTKFIKLYHFWATCFDSLEQGFSNFFGPRHTVSLCEI